MKLKRGLIVSSQALNGNPMKDPEKLAAMAEAASLGGAVAIRANGVSNIAAMQNRFSIPIIGINKFEDETGTVVITPTFDSAKEVASAGAQVIALDATLRTSSIKEDTRQLIDRIHNELHLEVMADISNLEEALYAQSIGADYISTTLSGYTKDRPYAKGEKYIPDFSLIKSILESDVHIPVIAEGRFWRREDLEFAFKMGVHAVVIGKAITNPMAITEYFCQVVPQNTPCEESIPKTEDRNENTIHLDTMSTWDVLRKINEEDAIVANRVRDQLDSIAIAVDAILPHFQQGGRIVYCGAGTSARLAVADAAECPPTFGVPHDRIVACIAGGKDAVFRANENMEDQFDAGTETAKQLSLTSDDSVIAVSANGNAAFCLGFVQQALIHGCTTVALVNNRNTSLADACDYSIEILTGAEVIKGSTRMKAGTSQKMVLNMISTTLFVRSGYVKSNLMINLRGTNTKLRKRAIAIIQILTGADESACIQALEQHNWSVAEAMEEFYI